MEENDSDQSAFYPYASGVFLFSFFGYNYFIRKWALSAFLANVQLCQLCRSICVETGTMSVGISLGPRWGREWMRAFDHTVFRVLLVVHSEREFHPSGPVFGPVFDVARIQDGIQVQTCKMRSAVASREYQQSPATVNSGEL